MAEDQREIEAKFFISSLSQIERLLHKLNGRLLSARTFEVNVRFDTRHRDLSRAGRVLRLRKDYAARLTYKGDSQVLNGALSRREIEFVVEDFDSARQFIEALGYEVVFIYEKYRTTFEYHGVQIMLDELPYGNFIEIEGELEMLHPVANELKLEWSKAIPASYHRLFERLRRSRGLAFRDLTFENLKGIRVSPKEMMIEFAEMTEF